MRKLLTPHRVALAIGVSESSLKRWCDRGLIPTVRTPGGHRRIPIHGVLEFLRANEHELVRPEVLGLPPTTGKGERIVERAEAIFRDALAAGDEQRARQVLLDLYLAGHRLSAICDRMVTPAFSDLGRAWECGQIDVFQERCGCEVAESIFCEMRDALPPVSEEGPLALGGTPSGDPYRLPTRMAELVLRSSGWRSRSLGTDLPFASLAEAALRLRPRLFWLSVSHVAASDAFLQGYALFAEKASAAHVAVVAGGRGLVQPLRRQMGGAVFCENMQELEAIAKALRTA